MSFQWDEEEVQRFWDHIWSHPEFAQCQEHVGRWQPGMVNVGLDGSFTAAQLRVIADYMEKNAA